MRKILPVIIITIFLVIGAFLFSSLSAVNVYAQYPEDQPDINLAVRSYSGPLSGRKELLDYHLDAALADYGRAPQLSTLIEGNAAPNINNLYQVYHWDWDNNARGPLITRPDGLPGDFDFFTLIGLGTNSGDNILVPDSDYDIGGGYEAMVLFATSNSITLKYTREDNMVLGYGIHLEGLNVDSEVLRLYNQLDSEGRKELPLLCAGQRIGTASKEVQEIKVAVRDTGSFMDPRWKNDWWQKPAATANTTCQPSSSNPTAGPSIDEEGFFTVHGPSMGFFDALMEPEKETREESAKASETPEPSPTSTPSENEKAFTGSIGSVLAAFVSSSKQEGVSGKSFYDQIVFPNLSGLDKLLKLATRTILPSAITPSLSGTPVAKIYTEVYPYEVEGEGFGAVDHDAAATCEEASKHEEEIENTTGAALGPVALNGPFTSESEIDELGAYRNYKLRVEEVDYSCSAGFSGGAPVGATKHPQPEEVKPEFSLGFLGIIQSIEEVITNVITKITKNKTKYKAAYKAHIPTFNASAQYATKMASRLLPESWIAKWEPQDEAKALVTGSSAENQGAELKVEVSGFEGGTTSKTHYGDLGKWRNFAAASYCSVVPEEVALKGRSIGGAKVFGESAPKSCNPEDYMAPTDPRSPCEDPNDTPGSSTCPLPQYCSWVGSYSACRYGTYCNPNNSSGYPVGGCPDNLPGEGLIEPGCADGQDPICESCLGLPHGYAVGEHMKWCGGDGGPRDCLADCSRCQWIYQTSWEEDTYSDDRFDGCYYANANVCVQTNPADQSPGNICQYGCSPDCCKFCSN